MRGWTIGRIAGMRISIHWTWLLLFALITTNLTLAFRAVHEDWSAGLAITLAGIAALALFASVLLHELAHSFMARARGLDVRDITLFLFGGVSNIEREPPSAKSEFLITIVGPLTSFALGVAFLAAAIVAIDGGTAVLPGLVLAELSAFETILLWLGQINIALAIFNLVPGFPLDGGRILRSAVWSLTGDLRRATRAASLVGRVVAWALVTAGVLMALGVEVPVFGSGVVGGLWLVFIGLFLDSAAVGSYQQVLVHQALDDVHVRDVMRSRFQTVSTQASLDSLVHDHIMGTDQHGFPVLDQRGDLAGIVCLHDVRRVQRDRWPSTSVADVMTVRSELACIDADAPAEDALRLITARQVDQLPVMSEGQLAGVVRRPDIMRWLELAA